LQVFDFDHAVRIFAFDEPRGLHRVILPVAVTARRAVDPDFKLRALSLRLILRRVRQRPFMLEHLAEITTVDPAAAGRAPEEMLGLARWRIADTLA
jgi:hypothetical protein